MTDVRNVVKADDPEKIESCDDSSAIMDTKCDTPVETDVEKLSKEVAVLSINISEHASEDDKDLKFTITNKITPNIDSENEADKELGKYVAPENFRITVDNSNPDSIMPDIPVRILMECSDLLELPILTNQSFIKYRSSSLQDLHTQTISSPLQNSQTQNNTTNPAPTTWTTTHNVHDRFKHGLLRRHQMHPEKIVDQKANILYNKIEKFEIYLSS